MKKITIAILAIFTFFGCDDDKYESLNVNESDPSTVPASFLLTSATTSLFDQMVSTNVNDNVFRLFSQYWTQTQYTDEGNFDLTTRNIPENHWGDLYRNVLYDLKDAKEKVANDVTLLENEKNNRIAVIDILEVYTWQILVDSFGDIPYTEALQGLANPTPVYDDAATIYEDLISRITNDIDMISESDAGFGSDDIIYHGDMSAWKKFAASVKLRLGVNLLDVNSSLANSTITSAVDAGVFDSNADNFEIDYLSTSPYQNPLAVDLNSRNDFVAANTIVDKMNALDDPRRPFYFQENLGSGVYVGGVYSAGSAFSAFSHVSELFYDYTTPGVLLDLAEVEFLQAEAKAKGVSLSGSVEDYYNAGIEASMDYWGVEDSEIASYLSQSDVDFSSAGGSDLEKIANQFWLAMYNRGFEGWNVWRRLDAPTLTSPAPISLLPIPLRLTYPVGEQTLNGANRTAAAQAIGGDTQQTPVFWDVN